MFIRQQTYKITSPLFSVFFRNKSTEIRDKLKAKIDTHRREVSAFVKKYGKKEVGKIRVEQVYGGMRGILALICETSWLDPDSGIRFRELSIDECQKKLPKANGGKEPLPESVFWLLLTGDVPTKNEVELVSKEWAARATLPDHVESLIKHLPKNVHPMSMLSAAVTVLNNESQFMKQYSKGMKKSEYWIPTLEDALNLTAKLPAIAATVYSYLYKDGKPIPKVSLSKDWSWNLALMLGIEDPNFIEFLRLYLTIHCCHEGGNVSAHACHLVGSALADPYLSFAAGMNGLAGPLHGRATQDCLIFLNKILKDLGDSPTDDQMKDYIQKTLKSGQIVPGYGHAVLRKTDPRFTVQREFAEKHIKDDPVVNLVAQVFKVTPAILQAKVKNPWPNVDAHSGAILQHFGIKEMEFYTVLFGVSRSLGTMANIVWARAMGYPIERPRSGTTRMLELSMK